jgi:hypothetical protein
MVGAQSPLQIDQVLASCISRVCKALLAIGSSSQVVQSSSCGWMTSSRTDASGEWNGFAQSDSGESPILANELGQPKDPNRTLLSSRVGCMPEELSISVTGAGLSSGSPLSSSTS